MTALRAEAGVWYHGARIDMLLLRVFCKFASSADEAPLEAVQRAAGGPALSK